MKIIKVSLLVVAMVVCGSGVYGNQTDAIDWESVQGVQAGGVMDDPEKLSQQIEDSKGITDVAMLRYLYDTEVRDLRKVAKAMKAVGKEPEEIARTLHKARRLLGLKYKGAMPEFLRKGVYERNIKMYGDPLGPTIKYLRNKGKSWEDIIKSSQRPGGANVWYLKPVYYVGYVLSYVKSGDNPVVKQALEDLSEEDRKFIKEFYGDKPVYLENRIPVHIENGSYGKVSIELNDTYQSSDLSKSEVRILFNGEKRGVVRLRNEKGSWAVVDEIEGEPGRFYQVLIRARSEMGYGGQVESVTLGIDQVIRVR